MSVRAAAAELVFIILSDLGYDVLEYRDLCLLEARYVWTGRQMFTMAL